MASFSSPAFRYPSLPKGFDSLRVLMLLPKETSQEAKGATEDHDHIVCELFPRTFASKPVYECLSYTWGTQPANKNITVNGQHFLVRENLFNALRQLRRGEARPLWVDAICINQADIQERNAQVSLMAFIYKRATKVLVWLGLPPHKYTEADRGQLYSE
jgi:hypothetical protein